MKGVVFTEFVEMVEETFSPELADQIMTESDLASGGAYTAVGTYDHREILALVTNLSANTGISIQELVRTFGIHLLGRFVENYPQFFETSKTTFDFLETIENHVHVEVIKLYHDAELPSFVTERLSDQQLVMTYRSFRPLADLAEGLILGTIDHFSEEIQLVREDKQPEHGHETVFTLTKK